MTRESDLEESPLVQGKYALLADAARVIADPLVRNRAEAVRSYLMQQGITETELLPLKAPAGLDIQAARGDEIALSIMAEIVQRRRNVELLDLALFHEPEPADVRQDGEMEKSAEIAIDPICHMEVKRATAVHVSEFEGKPYYFCCAGCKTTFEANPALRGRSLRLYPYL